MLFDGKKHAEEILTRLEGERGSLPEDMKLGVIMAEGDEATKAFVRIKERVAERLNITLVRAMLGGGATTEEAREEVSRVSKECAGLIVQMPLPSGIDTDAVLSAVLKEQDVDGVNPQIPEGERLVEAPVAGAVRSILSLYGIPIAGRKAVVVGRGRLVGKPAAYLLKELDAEVTILSAGDSLEALADADIIVSGAGKPRLIRPEHIKEGVVLIDAGTSESSGKVAGDADPSCEEKCALFTPVPGGVGPVAVAMLFSNLFVLAARRGA